MPYNPGTGIYTLPAIYLAVPGTTIIAAQHNTPLEDLEVANNYARPIVAGGTGQNSAVLARGSTGLATMGNIGVKGANIASAAALTLVDNFNYNHVTGVVTVTSISTRPAGEFIMLEFEAALILTHNAVSLILPGGSNFTTAAGDLAWFVSEGSGNWRMASYSRAAGNAETEQSFSTPGAATWTKPAGCIRVKFDGCGGGGGSGGINGTGANTGVTAGAGSGFSGTTGILDVSAVATVELVIGAAGTAGDFNSNGGNGGNTTAILGATTYTFGGGGGSDFINVGAGVGSVEGGIPGIGTNVIGFGQQGGIGVRSTTDNNVTSGSGGSSFFGTGGLGRHSITPAAAGGGLPGTGFGAGAGGAFNNGVNSDQAGAAGTGGYIRATEYYV